MANTTPKARYWAFVAYEESLPQDYATILNKAGIQWAKSPYHDKDKNPDGTTKKAHWHFILVWPGPTTLNAVRRITVDTLHSTEPVMLVSPRGYYRYFTHADNPEKYQYCEHDITSGGGFDLIDYFSESDLKQLKRETTFFVIEHNITEYADAINILSSEMDIIHLDVFMLYTNHFKTLCASLRYKQDTHNSHKRKGATTTSPHIVTNDENKKS